VFKVHFLLSNKKESINHTIDFKKIIQQKHAPFYESKCSLDGLDKKPNHTKNSKFSNFEGKGYKAKDSFFKPFDKKIMFNGFKMSSFRCKSHVQKLILPKNMFGCPLKLILGFSAFLALK
jgi:hypothetical protein